MVKIMILDKIAESTKKRVEKDKTHISLEEMKALAMKVLECDEQEKENDRDYFCFESALKKEDINFICEVKKASPSKGIIAEEFNYTDIAKEYEKAGAACISVLTEPEYFMGSNEYLKEIRKEVSIPLLRKDFTLEEYQIYQAKVLGADCVLLICSLLSEEQLKEYIRLCDLLRLSALVEAHDEDEVKCAVRAGARIIGVNNRDLKTFSVDINNSKRLRKLVPENILFVAESGIKNAADVEALRKAKVNGVLIGETLMKSKDKKQMLNNLRG